MLLVPLSLPFLLTCQGEEKSTFLEIASSVTLQQAGLRAQQWQQPGSPGQYKSPICRKSYPWTDLLCSRSVPPSFILLHCCLVALLITTQRLLVRHPAVQSTSATSSYISSRAHSFLTMLDCEGENWNHRTIAWLWLERTLKTNEFQSLCHEQGCQPPDNH